MSNLNIFKIGVGPSSSHTLGPMLAGNLFCEKISHQLNIIEKIQIYFYGSLSLTGKGHLSDKAIIWGLNNIEAKNLDTSTQQSIIEKALRDKKINLCGKKEINFDYQRDLIFSKQFLLLHENGLVLKALDKAGNIVSEETYYSIGGGFVKTAQELQDIKENGIQEEFTDNKLVFNHSKDILEFCRKEGKNLIQASLEYELQFNSLEFIHNYCLEIWQTMQEVYNNGIKPQENTLPGNLKLNRRAPGLFNRIQPTADPLGIIDFISLYAIAIAEENASGAKVVTAPTNGACAVNPAVMLYLKNHTLGFNDQKAIEFLLVGMLIGSLYKKNASISGAEAGCQAEIGVASSMAAAAMASVLGADAFVSSNAAESAMEHHLGLTCDPVGGLVQIPCIERNAFGAIKAIMAARMAMSRKSTPKVTLDEVILTMYNTGKDMNLKYKETSLGGLATTLSSLC
ncbi:L-serine ammonia-lyase [Helicobacter cappadocius]|uniref:L-serine dehydratase n=1 Tax=Helicobacter cappadocius TaxID=3063998 RepID=A0AA90PJD0_9HELI|nr:MULTISPECIES: L-serine ammonia-lyase [unclassified Helicobacter]MDO7253409.1 L-serine ammonia-lyase [Helicobacter sp. faydin-H75]MDP2539327.1 L-serine ammonia-lyase [Helicobacter sp. faydin-H76]